MISDKDIVFLTTTIFSECLELQQLQIKKLFPQSTSILIDGSNISEWPNSMFKWVDELNSLSEKYFILIDEDCFLINKSEIIKVLEMLESNKYNIIGCPDGYHPFRTCNPIVLNPFLLFGKVEDFKKRVNIKFSSLKYRLKSTDSPFLNTQPLLWTNSEGLKFKHYYKDLFVYEHPIIGDFSFQDGKEPYYCFFWYLLENDFKIGYLFPYLDGTIPSTNPKINKDSKPMAIHTWESRNMKNETKIFNKTAKERFETAKKYIQYEHTV